MNTKPLVVVAIALLTSCNPPTPPVPTGTLYGKVVCTPSPTTDQSGVTVTAATEGTTVTATTDAAGRWMLTNLPTGSYSLSFQREGFGSPKIPAYAFCAPGKARLIETPYLRPMPTHNVTNVSVSVQNATVKVTGIVNGSSGTAGLVLLFFGLSQTVSSNISDHIYVAGAYSNAGTFSCSVPFTTLRDAGAPVNGVVYVTVYPASTSEFYNDVETGRMVYTHVSPTHSNTVNFTVN